MLGIPHPIDSLPGATMSDRLRMVFPLYGSIAANASEAWDQVVSIPNGESGVVTKARFMPDTNVTAHATNNADLSIEINTTEIASEQTTIRKTNKLPEGTEKE